MMILNENSIGPDFVKQDVKRLYKHLLPYVKISIVEAGPALLGPFDKALQDYVLKLFGKRDIDVRLGTAVLDIEDYGNNKGEGDSDEKKSGDPTTFVFAPAKRALLSDGSVLPFGTWSGRRVWRPAPLPNNSIRFCFPATPGRNDCSLMIIYG
jgi:hypothetical protein